jgi:hypothetical protein
MKLKFWKAAALGVLAAIGLTTNAQAGLLPLSSTVTPDGDNYRYTYGVMLTSNSTLTKGDSFVIFDFAGFVPDSNVQPADFVFSTSNVGGTSGRTMPNDNPALPNLIWTYTGDTPLTGQIGLGNFSAISTKPESSTATDFTSRTQVDDLNGGTRVEENITPTKAPSGTDEVVVTPPGVPEPSTMILLAAGLPILAGARVLRNRRKEAAAV